MMDENIAKWDEKFPVSVPPMMVGMRKMLRFSKVDEERLECILAKAIDLECRMENPWRGQDHTIKRFKSQSKVVYYAVEKGVDVDLPEPELLLVEEAWRVMEVKWLVLRSRRSCPSDAMLMVTKFSAERDRYILHLFSLLEVIESFRLWKVGERPERLVIAIDIDCQPINLSLSMGRLIAMSFDVVIVYDFSSEMTNMHDSSSDSLLPEDILTDAEIDAQLDKLREQLVKFGRESAELHRELHVLEKECVLSSQARSVADALGPFQQSSTQEMFKEAATIHSATIFKSRVSCDDKYILKDTFERSVCWLPFGTECLLIKRYTGQLLYAIQEDTALRDARFELNIGVQSKEVKLWFPSRQVKWQKSHPIVLLQFKSYMIAKFIVDEVMSRDGAYAGTIIVL
ncbi:hypothetical protein ACLOJK_007705 [Asimina triloba]